MNKKIIILLLICLLTIGSLAPSFSVAQTVGEKSPDLDEILPNYGFIFNEDEHNNPEDIPVVAGEGYVLPSSWDWRNVEGNDFTTHAKNQGDCGSCYAFSAIGSLESVIKIAKSDPYYNIDLSEQYIVSCCSHGCDGCDGGAASYVYDWMFYGAAGAITESCFDYTSGNNGLVESCENKCSNWDEQKIEIDGSKDVQTGPEHIKRFLIKYGPLVVSMVACEDLAENYDGGVYINNNLKKYKPNHQVVIVGYEDTPNKLRYDGYWIVKNSWGGNWGNNGFFNIAYGQAHIDDGYGDFVVPRYHDDNAPQPNLEVNTNSLHFPDRKTNKKSFILTNDGDAGSKMIWYARVYSGLSWIKSVEPSSGLLEKGESVEITVEIDWFGDASGSIDLHRFGGSANGDEFIKITTPKSRETSLKFFQQILADYPLLKLLKNLFV